MGMVYRARDTRLNREVAVKVLPPDLARDSDFVARFRREAETAAGLDHPHIVAIYNIGEQNGVHYLAMRLLQGQPLNHILKHDGALPLERALHITEQLARALDYAHGRGVIHRDVKPANIMVGEDAHVTLMDFGIAKAMAGSSITRTGTMIGTPEYMAPEQFTGETVDARADVYALSIVVYEMLTGYVPFSGDTPVAVSHGHVYQQPAPPRQYNPHIPPAVEQAVLRGLAKRPEARYPNAGALIEALRTAVRGGPAPVSPPAPQPLKIVTPDGYEHALVPGTLHLGRSAENDVVINDPQISRQHAEIRSDAHSSAVIDLNSANGTFVNGQRLAPHRPKTLQAGMAVRLGTEATVRVQAGMPAKQRTVRFAQPDAGPPYPPDRTTARASAPSPGRKNKLLGRVSGFGCVLGAIGIGVIAIVIIGLIVWNNLRGWATPTPVEDTPVPATAVIVTETEMPTPHATQTAPPVTIAVTDTPRAATPTAEATYIQEWRSLGKSVRGWDLAMLAIGYEDEVSVVVIGSIQGDQPRTIELVQAIIDNFQRDPGQIPPNVAFYLIPTINPDGNAANSRFNANNVDLNRNWDTSDWIQNAAVPGHPNGKPGAGGSRPFSEPETRALSDLLHQLNSSSKLRVLILHSSVSSPNQVYAGGNHSKSLADSFASIMGYTMSADWGSYTPTGEAITWCAEQRIQSINAVIPANRTPSIDLTIQALLDFAQQP